MDTSALVIDGWLQFSDESSGSGVWDGEVGMLTILTTVGKLVMEHVWRRLRAVGGREPDSCQCNKY